MPLERYSNVKGVAKQMFLLLPAKKCQESVFLIEFLNWKIDLVVLISFGRSFHDRDPELIKVRLVKRVLD